MNYYRDCIRTDPRASRCPLSRYSYYKRLRVSERADRKGKRSFAYAVHALDDRLPRNAFVSRHSRIYVIIDNSRIPRSVVIVHPYDLRLCRYVNSCYLNSNSLLYYLNNSYSIVYLNSN